MENTIESLAVNSWTGSKYLTPREHWQNVEREFFGMYRLWTWINDRESAELAKFLSDLAMYRRRIEG